MERNIPPQPRPVHQVMVSSTFTDLKEHRAALIDAIHRHDLHANVMEHDDAKVRDDVIESSLKMVRDSAAYILVVGSKYGQTPEDAGRNPDKVSITELEFNEARDLGCPILLFIMGDDHPVKKSDIEKDPEKEKKLNAFRERAKIASPGGKVNRVYSVFNSLEEFMTKFASSLTELCRLLDSRDRPAFPHTSDKMAVMAKPSPKKKTILAVFANPSTMSALRLAEEERAIRESIQLSEHRDAFRIETAPAATVNDVARAAAQNQTGHPAYLRSRLGIRPGIGNTHRRCPRRATGRARRTFAPVCTAVGYTRLCYSERLLFDYSGQARFRGS